MHSCAHGLDTLDGEGGGEKRRGEMSEFEVKWGKNKIFAESIM